MDIGFIGGGMMATALIGGLEKAGATTSSRVSVSEPYAPLREKHAKAGRRATTSNLQVVRDSDVVFLAVKPDVIPAVLTE